jgi:hypothetical protein
MAATGELRLSDADGGGGPSSGLSQYSAVSPSILINTTLGSVGPCGIDASMKGFQSSSALMGSVTIRAGPEIEIHVSADVSVTLT